MLKTNAVLLAVSVAILFPAAILVAEHLSDGCTSSFERGERAMALWAVVVAITTLLAVRANARTKILSVLFQLAIVAAAAITLPNLDFGSLDRTRQKRTLANMRSIMIELDAIRARTGTYPSAASVIELQRVARTRLSAVDGWGNPLMLQSTPRGYTLTSYGLCGARDTTVRDERDVRADIVVVNGERRR